MGIYSLNNTLDGRPISSTFDILYSDDFCELTDDFLRIKKYFFPSLKTKVIRVKDLKVVYFEAQQDAKFAQTQRKTWGMGKNGVHWAADFSRCLPGEKGGKTDIILDIEDGVKKGFTIRDSEAFLNAMRCVAPMSLIIVDSLNIQ